MSEACCFIPVPDGGLWTNCTFYIQAYYHISFRVASRSIYGTNQGQAAFKYKHDENISHDYGNPLSFKRGEIFTRWYLKNQPVFIKFPH